jgi:hypothetical protein
MSGAGAKYTRLLRGIDVLAVLNKARLAELERQSEILKAQKQDLLRFLESPAALDSRLARMQARRLRDNVERLAACNCEIRLFQREDQRLRTARELTAERLAQQLQAAADDELVELVAANLAGF